MTTLHRKTDEFTVVSSDGRTFRVIEYTPMDDFTTIHDSTRRLVPGIPYYRQPNGHPVNRLGDGDEYEIVSSGLRVTRRR